MRVRATERSINFKIIFLELSISNFCSSDEKANKVFTSYKINRLKMI